MRIIIGDVHGCLRELEALVAKIGYRQGRDSLTFVGDLLDRGPYPVETVAYAMQIGGYSIRGNHEDNALRWLGYEERVQHQPGFVNPMEKQQERKPKGPKVLKGPVRPKRQYTPEERAAMKAAGAELARQRQDARVARGEAAMLAPPSPSSRLPKPPRAPIPEQRKDQWRALSPEQRRWLDSSVYIDLARDWYVVHAGLEPLGFGEQTSDRIMRLRYVDPTTGRMVTNLDGSLDQPPGSVWWMDVWPGPQNIIYGHAVHSLTTPRIDVRETPHGIVRCFGIDTGCCYGGRLTAMVFEDDAMRSEPSFVQVDAQETYVRSAMATPS